MLIGIDTSRTVRRNRTGTENYALHLTRAMLEKPREHRFRLYFNNPPPSGLFPEIPRCEHRSIPWPRLWTHLRLSAELIQRAPDVLFVPSHVLPLVCPVPGVVTVHDLGYLAYPEAHRRFDRWYLDWTTRRHTRVAAHLLADSEATRQDLIRYYNADPERITVVYPGLNPTFRPIDDPDQLAAVRSRYDIGSDYIIHVGTLQPRKNISRLLDAFERIHNSQFTIHNSQFQLVLAGKPGWLSDDLVARAKAMGDRVRLTGRVAQGDLPALISGARALVMPSLYEGFGFPVLEAMACSTPVVASNVSSLPEVAGDAALLVDPHDTNALADALARILTDAELRAELRRRGLQRAQRFTWRAAAEKTLNVLETVAHNSQSTTCPEPCRRLHNSQFEIRNPKFEIRNPKSEIRNPKSEILGVQIDNVTTEQALHRIASFVEEGTPRQIITVNPEFVMTAQRLPAFREVINQADLRIPDGVGLLWAARRQGTPLQERVAGSDMIPLIAQQAARLGHRIFLLGAAPGVAEKAAARLVHLAPGVMIVGTYAGSPAVEEEDEIVEMARARAPDILLVAYGAPQQDLWIARNLDRLTVPVAMGVGGAFDFLAGVTRRAPPWVRRLGFEWLHRLIQEPWRWRRQLDIPRFMWHVVREDRNRPPTADH